MSRPRHLCPECGMTEMVFRFNRQTAAAFYGCPAFPECTGTRELDGLPSRRHPDPHGNMEGPLEESYLDNGGWGAD